MKPLPQQWLLLVIALASLPAALAGQVCAPLSQFLTTVPPSAAGHSLTNWTTLVATLDSLDLIGFMIAPTPSMFLIPSDAAIAKLQAERFVDAEGHPEGHCEGQQAGTGPALNNVSDFEVDRLLSLVYYHVVPSLPSLTELVEAGSADTYLDQLTSGGEMLTFSSTGSQVNVSGWDRNNSAAMPNSTLKYPCSAVYIIDTVLLPVASLADIPPFSAIQASLGLSGSPGSELPGPMEAEGPAPETDVFDLPMAPGPAAVVKITGPSISAPAALAALGAFNDNMSSPVPAANPASSNPAPGPAPASSGAAGASVWWQLSKWTQASVGIAAIVVAL